MLIEIFEARGLTNTDELDGLLIELHKKYREDIAIIKVNVLNHRVEEVIRIVKERGMDSLPIIRIDGKISSITALKELLKRQR